MICIAAGCADNVTYEPNNSMQKKALHEVTQIEARKNLERIIQDLKIPTTRGGKKKDLPPITSVYTMGHAAETTRSGETVEPYFHIFNFGDNEGFAIMSGDNRVEPLLAFTFKGELTPETEINNPGFEIAYSKMEEYYIARTMIDPSIPIPPEVPLPDPIHTIEFMEMPLGHCQVQWGQGYPYNRYCTIQPGDIPTYTGCVATAVAQIMSIYKYPSSYTKHYPNNHTYYFNWEEMNLYTNNTNSNPFKNDSTKYDQIAHLMRQLGNNNNLNMTYSGNGSSCTPNNIPRTLRNFGYTNGGRKIPYQTDSVVLELQQGYPVLLGGRKENAGHRWLGHGLMTYSISLPYADLFGGIAWTEPTNVYYILCNWGWDGDKDGYFLSGVFDLDDPYTGTTRSTSFPDGIDAIINIRK